MAWGNRATVAQADVEFNALTGQAELDIKRFSNLVEGQVNDVDRHLRSGALAWEKYERAMANVAPDSYQARRALVTLERELEAVRRETDRARVAQDRMHHSSRVSAESITKTSRGAIAASGAFKGLGNALFFASGAFAGGFGLIYALRTSIEAATRAQTANVRLAQAVRNSGIAWRQNRQEILDVIEAQSKLSSFDDEELKNSLSGLIIRTKDLDEAYRLLALSAGVARASGRTLEQSTILVTRASLGATSSLRRLGIDVDKVTTNTDRLRASGVKVTFQQRQEAKALDDKATRLSIISQLEEKFAGQSEKFANSAAGRQAYFNKVLEDTQEIIGVGILPTVNRLLTQFTKWLDKANKTGSTQETVNKVLDDTQEIVHGIAGAFKEAHDILGPVNKLFGGTYETTKLIIELWAAWKIVKIATAIRGIASTWGLVGPAATRAAATTVIAEEAIGDGALRQIPKIGALRAALAGLGFRGLIGAIGGAAVAGAAGLGLAAAGGAALLGIEEIDKRVLTNASEVDRKHAEIIASRWRKYGPGWLREAYSNATDKQKKVIVARLRSVGDNEALKILGIKNLVPVSGPPAPTTPTGGGGDTGPTKPPKKPPRTALDIQLDISRAEARNDEAAEIRFHRELIALYQRQAHNLERRKKLTQLQKQRLQQLYNDIDSEQGAIESIVSGQQSDARAAASRRAAAARKRHQQHKDKVDAHIAFLENQVLRAAETEGLADDRLWMKKLQAAYRAAAHDAELTAKERAAYEKKRLTARAKAKKAREEATEKRLDLKEQRLRNAVDRAELTDTLVDDKKTLRALIAFYKAEEHNMNLAEKARNEAERKRIAAQKKLKKLTDDKKKGVQSGAEFLASLQGTLNTYGGNLFAPGELNVGGRRDGAMTAHTIINTTLLREQNRILTNLSDQVRTPASSQGYTNMTSLYDGYATA